LKRWLGPSPEHPLWLLRIGSHLVFASPFEQTTVAAWRLERALVQRWTEVRGDRVTASPLSLCGDYAGYLTTPREYALQRYEGAHTLYGRHQLETLSELFCAFVGDAPLRRVATEPLDTPELQALTGS
jgi:neutral ceramidase